MIGTPLGHYEIVESLGAGGMGEVYRARDSSLKREVAIKVLPEDFADDPERLARLEREAHLLAALNHSNIATIFSLEESDGRRFLVMELVRGQSLEELLAGGPLGIEETLDICRQIAEALEAAHDQGIIHRDLKPANVLVTPEGRAKVLDFGLAKAVERAGTESDLSRSPTITIAATEAGVIMGTAPYMSPEQVRGKLLDKRTDIWAFGCVLFECLTGTKAFDRQGVADTLAAILEVEPSWTTLPAATPVAVQSLLRRALRKDPKRRLHDIADARIEIEEALGLPGTDSIPIVVELPLQPAWRRLLPWGVAAAGTVLGVAAVLWSAGVGPFPGTPAESAPEPYQYTISLPDDMVFAGSDRTGVAISRDGSRVTYLAQPGETAGVYVHFLGRETNGPYSGLSTRARFFSPDGEWIGYFHGASRELRKVSVHGGAPEKVCDLPAGRMPGNPGATWLDNDTIVFYGWGGLFRVPGQGGEPVLIAAPDNSAGEGSYYRPRGIPGRNAIVHSIFRADQHFSEESQIAVLDLDTGESKIIGAGNTPLVTRTGHLLFGQGWELFARGFDFDALEPFGAPLPVQDGLTHTLWGDLAYEVAENGTLAYVPGGPSGAERLVWVDEEGVTSAVIDDLPRNDGLRLSPNDRFVAFNAGAFNEDIELHELGIGSLARLERDWRQTFSAWMPDESAFFFRESDPDGSNSLWYYDLGTHQAKPFVAMLPEGYRSVWPTSVSPDGRWLAAEAHHSSSGWDILLVPLDEELAARVWLAGPIDESRPYFSPDGRLIAYYSDRSGVTEPHVRPVASTAPLGRRVAAGDTRAMKWGPDSGTLYYFQPSEGSFSPFKIWGVSVGPEAEPTIGEPEVAFDFGKRFYYAQRFWDVGNDGRLLVTEHAGGASGSGIGEITIILNWTEKLKELVPTER